MREQLNRISKTVLIVLSIIALVTVLNGYRYPYVPNEDEGAGAHIFQISVVALLPTLLVFLSTADWVRPARNIRFLAVPTVILTLAFCALYYLEHGR